MTGDVLTYEEVLRELQIEEVELDRLIVTGSLNKIETPDGTRFSKAEVTAIKEDLEAMKTINLDKLLRENPPE